MTRIDQIQDILEEYADCQDEMDSRKLAVEIDYLYEEDMKLAQDLRDQFLIEANINVLDY